MRPPTSPETQRQDGKSLPSFLCIPFSQKTLCCLVTDHFTNQRMRDAPAGCFAVHTLRDPAGPSERSMDSTPRNILNPSEASTLNSSKASFKAPTTYTGPTEVASYVASYAAVFVTEYSGKRCCITTCGSGDGSVRNWAIRAFFTAPSESSPARLTVQIQPVWLVIRKGKSPQVTYIKRRATASRGSMEAIPKYKVRTQALSPVGFDVFFDDSQFEWFIETLNLKEEEVKALKVAVKDACSPAWKQFREFLQQRQNA
jgi:hypothetical protein